MTQFRVTFGSGHRFEPHAVLGLLPDLPDQWFDIEAEDEQAARERLFELLGNRWAFLYEKGRHGWPTKAMYPGGSLGDIERYFVEHGLTRGVPPKDGTVE